MGCEKTHSAVMLITNKEKPFFKTRIIYGKSIAENAIHGSDSKESAEKEINFFFSKNEINKRIR